MLRTQGTSYTLIRDPVRVRDQGDYIVNVQNSGGRMSAKTEVRVIPPHPSPLSEDTDQIKDQRPSVSTKPKPSSQAEPVVPCKNLKLLS